MTPPRDHDVPESLQGLPADDALVANWRAQRALADRELAACRRTSVQRVAADGGWAQDVQGPTAAWADHIAHTDPARHDDVLDRLRVLLAIPEDAPTADVAARRTRYLRPVDTERGVA